METLVSPIDKVKAAIAELGDYPYLGDLEGDCEHIHEEVVDTWRWGTIDLHVIEVATDSGVEHVGVQFRAGSGDSEGYEHEPDMWDYFLVEPVQVTTWRKKKA